MEGTEMKKAVDPGPTVDHASYLGASDIAAIAEENPFRTGLDVWGEKTKGIKTESNIRMEIGNAFERPALDVYARLTGVVLDFPGTLIHPTVPYFGATPDAIANGRKCVECKIVGVNMMKFWGEPEDGPDGVPSYVTCQLHWQSWIARLLNLAPCRTGDIVAVFGTEPRIYEVPIDESLIDGLAEIGRDFWEKYVVSGIMPTIEGNNARDIIAAIHPRNLKTELDPMTDDVRELSIAYNDIRDTITNLQKERDMIAARLTAAIGDRAGYEGAGIKATWKSPKGSPAWKKIAESLGRRVDRRIYDMTIQENTPELGARRLDVRIKK